VILGRFRSYAAQRPEITCLIAFQRMWLGIRQRAERRRQECQKQNESPDAKKMRRCAGAQSCSSASFMEDDWRSV